MRDGKHSLDRKFNKLFAYLISHEFKTPLTSIFGYAQMLQRKYDPEWNQEIVRQSIRMNHILDQGVVFNRLYYKNLEFNLTKTSLSKVFGQAAKKYKLAFPDSLMPEIAEDWEIKTDEGKLAQVFLDLMFLCQKVELSGREVQFELAELTLEKEKLYRKILKGEWENIKNAEEVGLFVDAQIIQMSGGKVNLEGKLIRVLFDDVRREESVS